MDTVDRVIMRIGEWVDGWPAWLKIIDPLLAVSLLVLYYFFGEQLPNWRIGGVDIIVAVLMIAATGIFSLDIWWLLYRAFEADNE